MAFGSAPLRAALGIVAILAGAAGIVVACLPDLESTPLAPATTTGKCGDGIINTGEECDPGKDASVPGCTKKCLIDCDAGGLPAGIDPATNHCYFQLSNDAEAADAAAAGCRALGAHVITLGSQAEQSGVNASLNPSPRANRMWLGLRPTPPVDGGALSWSTVVDEPGVGLPGSCAGCYASENHTLFPRMGTGTDPESECVTWRPGDMPLWSTASCTLSFPTVCEREPVGSRSQDCNGLPCFTVLATVSSRKLYEWSPTRVSASGAVAFCRELGSSDAGGTASLVVFESPEEREQVFYELLHLPDGNDASTTPMDFWVGLTLVAPDGGGPATWIWDNGKPVNFIPYEWGNHEPTAKLPGARAYALQTGLTANYAAPAATFDTQLVHAHDPLDAGSRSDASDALDAALDALNDGGDGGEEASMASDAGDAGDGSSGEPELHAVLCQVIPR